MKDSRKPAPTKSIAERMAEARAAMESGSKGSADNTPAGTTTTSSTSTATPKLSAAAAAAPTTSKGQSGGERCSVSGVV